MPIDIIVELKIIINFDREWEFPRGYLNSLVFIGMRIVKIDPFPN